MATRNSRQQRYISHSIDLFQGGMDSDASPYMLPPGAATLGENVEFYRDNTLRSRRGWQAILPASKTGMFITHRLQGKVCWVYRQGN